MDDDDIDAREIQRRALEEAFGESSDSGGDNDDEFEFSFSSSSSRSSSLLHCLLKQGDGVPLSWEMVDGVKGLWLCRGFLCSAQQSSLLSAIRREGWFDEGCHNQAMRFGDLPGWAVELSRLVREAVRYSDTSPGEGKESTLGNHHEEACWPLPLDLLWREPLFDQLIVNVYNPGEGICAHVDLMRFDDGIAIISLESACVMHFTRSKQEEGNDEGQGEEGSLMRVPVFLSPGSLVLMSGEARYVWKHEINRKQGFQLWEGEEIHQQRRTSVTLRKLCRSPDENMKAD
ncbi:hypothetical protein OPV22_001313 [Ensete ventricosum]|uniref:Fe2OG dioxygenase domain-containing protein n=1 Tax=Ensete ventricosum TaxID=4639 RepID=A0AAV8RW98_ENSVE|nr:hypothetical protein OPV22_001313 [Ensete ventricosum]